ncbi:MAG: hypothetical protein FJ304_00360 [Planctomycetes bacterium]|nr:hypothetical protein [Planctomycetota bacterium]
MHRAALVTLAAAFIGCGGEVKDSAKAPQPGPPDPLPRADDPAGNQKGLRVLFVGNSHTFTNDVPGLVAKLAKAANEERPLLAASEAPGGTSFQLHWNNGRVQQRLTEVNWDLVVLQDQSVMPNLTRAEFEEQTLPFARKLNEQIQASGARTVLFMTWGYKHDFVPMQRRSDAAYRELAADLKADLVPVGGAWAKARAARAEIELWSGDGNHADVRGSYLTACCFYAAFYGKSPVGNTFTAGLSADDAKFLQETAAGAVAPKSGGLAALAPVRVP